MIRSVLLLITPMLIGYVLCQASLRRVARAVGSDDSVIEYHPYTVSVHSSTSDEETNYCGGFVVSSRNVITACHCITSTEPINILVRVGSNYLLYGGSVTGVKSATCNPEYSVGTEYSRNDIAVLELAEPLNYGPTVRKIDLYNRVLGRDETFAQPAVLTGWGYQPAINDFARIIQKLSLPVISKNQCKEDFRDVIERGGEDAVFEDQICAGEKATTITKSICGADSGGPLVIEENGVEYVIGIAVNAESSYCDRPTYPNIFTEIAYHLPWLNSMVIFD